MPPEWALQEAVWLSWPVDDPRQRRPDIALAAQLLDWRPTVPLRDGLMRTIAYFETLLASEPIGPR